MKFIKQIALTTGLAGLLLNSGCVSNTSFTKKDTSTLTKHALKTIEQMPYATPYTQDTNNISPTLTYVEKLKAAKDYSNIADYSGRLLILDNTAPPLNPLKVQTQLNTTPLNNSLGALKAIENEMPEHGESSTFTLADLKDAKKYQLSKNSGLLGFINITPDKYNTGVRVNVEERNKTKNLSAQDKYKITLSFGVETYDIKHSRTDTRTPGRLAIGAAEGFVIAKVPGAALVTAIEGTSAVIDYAKGRKLPSNTRIVQNADNAGNLEQKVSNTHNIISTASKLKADNITVFSYNNGVQIGTTAVFTSEDAKGLLVGPSAEEHIGENQVIFYTSKKGASQFLHYLKVAIDAGLVRAGMELNEKTINNIINNSSGGSGGRSGDPGGSPSSGSGGRGSGVGGNGGNP